MPECLANDVRIHYEMIGEGKPVIMIHGFSPDSRLMIGCMEPLFKDREGYQRIYFDLPGMGKTENYENVAGSDDMLETVLEFIDQIIPNQSFLIAGESYGGYLAQAVIEKKKAQIDGAAFICPVIIPEAEQRELPEHAVIYEDKNFLGKLSDEEKADFSSMGVVLDEHVWERYKKEIQSGCNCADDGFLAKIKQHYRLTLNIDHLFFEKPSLFLLGRQDAVVGYKDALEIIEHYPKATFAVLDRAGHNLQIEQEGPFNVLVNEWLDRVSEAERSE